MLRLDRFTTVIAVGNDDNNDVTSLRSLEAGLVTEHRLTVRSINCPGVFQIIKDFRRRAVPVVRVPAKVIPQKPRTTSEVISFVLLSYNIFDSQNAPAP